ncbi:hypothetical protein RF11_02715 [Thelohanellus kitauei]|uniref:Uncharacterized protein n=1 Tax=Thelohanellus kitauei TaxID=669202 RepID=A0A0C2MLQ7_THEKT|nr:hypothetical protein RF11_02715 [Thelohanellus kitauei]
MVMFEKAVEMLIKLGDHEGVIEYTEEVAKKLSHPSIKKELVREFYENVLIIHDELSPRHLLNIYKFHQGEYFFGLREYNRSIELFQEVITLNVDSDCDKEMREQCLVYSSLIAILTKGDDAMEYIDLQCKKFLDFEESLQYLLIKKILESIQNKNFDELVDAVCH